jgi:hypothetical protein
VQKHTTGGDVGQPIGRRRPRPSSVSLVAAIAAVTSSCSPPPPRPRGARGAQVLFLEGPRPDKNSRAAARWKPRV